MKTKPAYLVINQDRRTIVRASQKWPTLHPGERAVRVSLEIADDIYPAHTLHVTDPLAILETVSVPADPPEYDESDLHDREVAR